MKSYITLGLLLASVSANAGTDALYAETRSDTGAAEKIFTPSMEMAYGGARNLESGDDYLYAETSADTTSGEKELTPEMEPAFEEPQPRFLSEDLYAETSNSGDGGEKELTDA